MHRPLLCILFVFIISCTLCAQHDQNLIKEAEKHLSEENYETAISLFDRALQLNPQNLGAVLGLAECQASLGDLHKTILYCNIATDIIENYKETYKNLKADTVLTKEKIDHHLKLLKKKEASVFHLKGKAKSKLHKFNDSFRCLTKAASLDSLNNDIWIDLGVLQYQQGNIQQSEFFFLQGLQISPSNFKASFNLANIYYEKGNLDKASEFYNYTVNIKQDFYAAWLHLGDIYMKQQKSMPAIDAFTTLINHGQSMEEAFFKRASAYNSLGFYEEALADWAKAYNANPNNYDALRNRGLMYMIIKEYEKAEADFTWLIENNPGEIYAYLNRAYNYLLIDENKKALKDVNHALTLKPDYAQAYYHRSLIYAFRKKKKKTCQDFQKALELGLNANEAEEMILKMCSP